MRDSASERPGASSLRRAAIVFAFALAVRVLYLVTLPATATLAINGDPISDMETFHRWALRIVEGDWLGKEDFHPYHPWQRGIAPEETWKRWYGPRVFHQDPLYPYFVAAVYAAAPPRPLSVIAVQLVLGAVMAAGVFMLAGRLASPRAAWISGGLAAVYGPFLFYESLLLRDTLLVLLTTAFLVLFEEARRRGGPAWWAAAGAAAGACYLTKPNIAFTLPLLVLWMLLAGEVARAGRAALALAVGFGLVLAPVVARNVALGAPAFKTTTRGAIEFINGNNPYHIGTGWFDGDDLRVTAYAAPILERTGAKLLPTIAEVLRSWRGRALELVQLQARKLGYFLAPYEMPNNASFSYFRMRSPVLSAGLPTFYGVAPLALLGIVTTAAAWRRLLPHYIFLASGVAVTVAFYVIARFRTPFLPLVLVFAGAGADALLRQISGRAWKAVTSSFVLIAILVAINTAANHPDRELVRPQDFWIASRAYAAGGDPAAAARELEEGVRHFPAGPALLLESGRAWEAAGEPDRALEAYRRALRLDPRSADLARRIRDLEASTRSGDPR